MLPKASGNDFLGRFREIVSDPLNLLIRRHPQAGMLHGDLVCLHNGLLVPVTGPDAYYYDFSNILVINRGVHEPLEEFVFQQLLAKLVSEPANQAPSMLELGAYWGHYSMWLKSTLPAAKVHLIEPQIEKLQSGRNNFARNGIDGSFAQAFVGRGQFQVDAYLAETEQQKLAILHADIQGYEQEMLEGCRLSLERCCVDYLFISTHSQALHQAVCATLSNVGYRTEISSDFDTGTTFFDGFVFASSPLVRPLFDNFKSKGRLEILDSHPFELLDFLVRQQ